MKYLLMTAGLAILCSGCVGHTGAKPSGNKSEAPEPATIQMNKADFLSKVVDYKADPENWIYLGDKPAVIDFYASWCGPCRTLSPVLENLARDYAEDIYVYKIDVDKEQELAAVFGIRNIPTLLFIPMEGQPTVKQGALPKNEIVRILETIMPAE